MKYYLISGTDFNNLVYLANYYVDSLKEPKRSIFKSKIEEFVNRVKEENGSGSTDSVVTAIDSVLNFLEKK